MFIMVNKQHFTGDLDGVRADDQRLLQDQIGGEDGSYLG